MSGQSASDATQDRRAELLGPPVALTISEAAHWMKLSEGAFRAHILPRCPKLYAGRSVRIPRAAFERFVERLAEEEAQEADATAAALLARTSR